jgi:L-aspartate oxidase
MCPTEIFCEILVIGSGIAGLSFALKMAEYASITIITKKKKAESSTNYAQGGIAAVLSPNDSFENQIRDTIVCGDGLSKKEIVEKIVRDGPDRIRELVDLGVDFSKTREGDFDLGLEGGHSKRRIIHSGDLTGKIIEQTLLDEVAKHSNIKLLENHLAINLVTRDNQCIGSYVLDREKGVIQNASAKITLLATGGIGRVYLHTSNPEISTGDGIAMAYRAGATIMNMEFTQFHPTCLHTPNETNFLISEALRGEGAILKDKLGRRFMVEYHPMKELAPRDTVARAVDHELKKSGEEYVFLDISFKDSTFIKSRFPGIYEKCLSFGIDITEDMIPVVPAAHYCCGGIRTTIAGETDLKSLFAIGETSCTGLHGANRLASNSLLEALVCAHYTARTCRAILRKSDAKTESFAPWDQGKAVDSDEAVVITQNRNEIRQLMWNYVGIVRTNKRLARAKKRITILKEEIDQYYWDFFVTPDLIELRNMVLVANLIIDSAMLRRESRGVHYSLDYPRRLLTPKDTLMRRATS